MGISATYVGELQKDKAVSKAISEGSYSVVLASPEAVLSTTSPWRKCLTRGTFSSQLKTVVIDEAHCITEWGADFRTEYRRLHELRSVIPAGTPFLAMTATATIKMRKEIFKNLNMNMDTTITVAVVPDRQNIFYSVCKCDKSMKTLNWLLVNLLKCGVETPKTIIYCRNVYTCSLLYEHFKLNISQDEVCPLVAMFHRSTAEDNKDHVLEEFTKSESCIRLVIATVAFGMGINIPDVHYVIHFGAPRGLEQFSQESGRGGRDGSPAVSVILYSGHDLAIGRATPEVKDFCTSGNCPRKILLQHFNLDRKEINVSMTKCKCCSICKDECHCGNCERLIHEDKQCDEEQTENTLASTTEECDCSRNLSSSQLNLLKENLQDLQSCLLEEMGSSGNMSPADLLTGLTDDVIESIVTNANYLLCEEDILSLGLWIHDLATDILELIVEVESR